MKKFLFMGALAAMLLGTASCSNEIEPEMTDGNVEFTIELPGAIESRAIADGTTATQLTVAVYDANGNHLNLDKIVTMSNKKATVRFQLVRGQKYSFAFWAQASGAPYTFNTADATMTVNNYTSDCNDEKRDAFYAYRADMEITGTMNETIYLYRPFAQLNFGASDVAAAAAAGVVAAKSYVEVKQVSTKFDLKTGHASNTDLVDAKFAMAAIPSDALTVEGTTYGWMAMNYFLVPADGENDKSNIETTLKLYTAANEANPVREITVPNVPVEKNHRTNILGNIFTDDVNFNIIIDEQFDQPDYNLDELGRPFIENGKVKLGTNGIEFETIADAIAANTNGDVIYLGAGTYDEAITVGADEIVKISSAGGLTAADVIIPNQVKTEAGATLELTNVKITSNVHGGASVEAIGANTHVVLDGVETSGRRGVNAGDGAEVTITNSKINADIDDNEGSYYNRGVNIYGNGTKVTVENSEVRCDSHYAFNYPGTADGTELILTDCNVFGWGILNVWGDNNIISINSCNLNSINNAAYNADGWNNFAAVVTNADADGNTFNINDCKLNVESKTGNKQYLMLLGGHNNVYNGANIDIKGVNTNTNGYMFGLSQSGATYTFNFDETVKGTWDGEAFSFGD